MGGGAILSDGDAAHHSRHCGHSSGLKSTPALWRGSLLPLGCGAAPKPASAVCQQNRECRFTTAAQPSGSKLPRHSD
ncbi:hypothetical protein DCO47_16485 [Pseudomonas sp. NDM]|nr:hypothetical protein DCO47_16485 [Pseudomonas sp. NDM]